MLLTAAIPKFAAQAIRKVYDIGWRPTHFLTSVSNSVGTVMKSAGSRERDRHHLGGVREGPHGPAVAGNNGIPGMVGVYAQV